METAISASAGGRPALASPRPTPTVSVFVASYNHAQFVGQALDSVLGQTFRDFEIVVVDDGSTDGSHDLLVDYQRRYPETIRYCWHQGHANLGVTRTSNAAIAQSRGQYLAWLGSDDVWLPEKLATQVDLIERHPGMGMVCSQAFLIDQAGQCLPGFLGKDVSCGTFRQWVVANPVCASTVLISRTCLDDVGWFNDALVYSDWDLFIRIAARYPIGFIGRPLACYRVHERNMSIAADPEIKLQRTLAVLASVFSTLPAVSHRFRDDAIAAAHFAAALDCLAAGHADSARDHLDTVRHTLNGALPVDREELIEMVSAHAGLPGYLTTDDPVRFVRTVCAHVAPALEQQAVAHFHITRAFACHLRHDAAGTRHHILRALRHNPRWLANRGVLSIGVQALLPRGAAARLQRFARALTPGGV